MPYDGDGREIFPPTAQTFAIAAPKPTVARAPECRDYAAAAARGASRPLTSDMP